MITKIGLTAGDIWNYLDNNNKKAALTAIIRNLKIDKEIVLMSIGWLAREGHVFLERKNTKTFDFFVTLTSKD